MISNDDRPPTDPAESLRLIERGRAEAGRRLTPDPRLLLWPWGVAWLVGFTMFFLRHGPGDRVFVAMPASLPLITLVVLLVTAGVITGVAGARAGRNIIGPSARQGMMYGITWAVAFLGVSVVLSRVSSLLPDGETDLLWAGTMVALVGALHMAGGAVWNDRALFALGAAVSGINVVGVLAGAGWHALIIAVAGGGGMLLAGTLAWLRWRG